MVDDFLQNGHLHGVCCFFTGAFFKLYHGEIVEMSMFAMISKTELTAL